MSTTLAERVAEKAEGTPQVKASSIADLIKIMQPEIKKALPSVMTPERFTRIALSAVKNTPKLAECTPISFLSVVRSVPARSPMV